MTDERHSIWLDAPSWFCRPNSTDWQMKLSFVREFSDLQASIVDSWFFNLVYSALYVSIHFLSGRVYEWFTHVCACLRAWVLKRRGAEIVISQGLEPPLPLLEALSKLRDEGLRDFSLTGGACGRPSRCLRDGREASSDSAGSRSSRETVRCRSSSL